MTLIFRKHYLDQIIRGEKTATRRISRPMVKAGGVYRLRTGFFNYLPERIRVRRLYRQRLGDMTDDAVEEGAPSLEAFRRDWSEIYDAWDEDRLVWVVEFEYLGPDQNL